MRLSMTALVAFLLAGTPAALAEEPNLLKPYLYQPPPAQLSPLEQQKALIDQAFGKMKGFVILK